MASYSKATGRTGPAFYTSFVNNLIVVHVVDNDIRSAMLPATFSRRRGRPRVSSRFTAAGVEKKRIAELYMSSKKEEADSGRLGKPP